MPYIGNLPAEAYSSVVKDTFNGDGSTVVFTMSQPSTTNNVRVVVENVIQDPSVAYTCSGATLTFTSAPPVGTANIYIIHLGPAVQTVTPPTEIGNATTYTSDLTVQGDLTASNSTVSGTLTVGDGHTIGNDGGDNLKFTSSTGESIVSESATGIHTWRDPSGEFGRFDASGNLLVNTTSITPWTNSAGTSADNAIALREDGLFAASRFNGNAAFFNRTGNDGAILNFNRDGSTVGRISFASGGIQIYATGVNNTGWTFGNGSAVLPMKNSALSDNFVDLGSASYRMDDLYATNNVIQTSDATEKQSIASLTDAEIGAAKAISKLFKTYKWNSSVEAKGDAARTHTGVIAQEVQQAMTDAGLDVGNYAFFIRGVWWEADETYTDDDGVEQTRTNTYDTLEEAPAGATQRTRLGIRYPELLAFIGAATEQRLASIEARLDALENA